MTTTIEIREITGEGRKIVYRARTGDHGDALARALSATYGRGHSFWQDSGLPAGYGSVIRSRPNTGNGWSADVVVSRVCVTA